MIKRTFFILIGIFWFVPLHAQLQGDKLQPEEYFDFWVGNWELTWEAPDGTMEQGTNRIQKILNGKVILENFSAETGRLKGYKGKSFSVFHKQSGTWKQTWVDSNQGYIDLVGELQGNKRIFKTKGPGPDGTILHKRMVFYDIAADSFTWDWESSTDRGKTWKLNWRIYYQRKK